MVVVVGFLLKERERERERFVECVCGDWSLKKDLGTREKERNINGWWWRAEGAIDSGHPFSFEK
jgi:hypothetical protein